MYVRSLEIEQRLAAMLTLIRTEHHSLPSLSRALGVSRPTAARSISALRERGHAVRAVRDAAGWHYELPGTAPADVSAGDGEVR